MDGERKSGIPAAREEHSVRGSSPIYAQTLPGLPHPGSGWKEGRLHVEIPAPTKQMTLRPGRESFYRVTGFLLALVLQVGRTALAAPHYGEHSQPEGTAEEWRPVGEVWGECCSPLSTTELASLRTENQPKPNPGDSLPSGHNSV